VKVFFDNCTSPVLASSLDGLIRHDGHAAAHIRDLPCGRHAKDIEWIQMLHDDPNEWVVITGDGRISRNPAERAAFRSAGLFGIVLAPGLLRLRVNQQASLLLWRWPDIMSLLRLVRRPALYELPQNRGSALRTLPL
jgi:hypothetical protein